VGCNPKTKARLVKFAIGRQATNVPLGLIIYAGRNQYNQLEEQGGLKNIVNSTVLKYQLQTTNMVIISTLHLISKMSPSFQTRQIFAHFWIGTAIQNI
jgi:hypothetical protein